jgi:endonuclease YncB( thermonuclease family)
VRRRDLSVGGRTEVRYRPSRGHRRRRHAHGTRRDDAPEKAQPFGTKSRENLAGKVFGKTVRVDVVDVDRYKREARAAKRGLWDYPNPVAPWEWRRTPRAGR